MRISEAITLWVLWRVRALHTVALLGFLSALPCVVIVSALVDGPSPRVQIEHSVVGFWVGRVVRVAEYQGAGLVVTLDCGNGRNDVVLACIELPSDQPDLKRQAINRVQGIVSNRDKVYALALQVPKPGRPTLGHLVVDGEWVNGTLAEEGLVRAAPRSGDPHCDAGRDAVLRLIEQAKWKGIGLWRSE